MNIGNVYCTCSLPLIGGMDKIRKLAPWETRFAEMCPVTLSRMLTPLHVAESSHPPQSPHRQSRILSRHYHDLMHTGDVADELQCDNQMLTFFDPIQTSVILAIPPQWIEEARRPPLTWYAFLSRQAPDAVTKCRILAPEYYESSGSNSS